jgi:hypothetical protein
MEALERIRQALVATENEAAARERAFDKLFPADEQIRAPAPSGPVAAEDGLERCFAEAERATAAIVAILAEQSRAIDQWRAAAGALRQRLVSGADFSV